MILPICMAIWCNSTPPLVSIKPATTWESNPCTLVRHTSLISAVPWFFLSRVTGDVISARSSRPDAVDHLGAAHFTYQRCALVRSLALPPRIEQLFLTDSVPAGPLATTN